MEPELKKAELYDPKAPKPKSTSNSYFLAVSSVGLLAIWLKYLHPEHITPKITYPEDIIIPTTAPIYQNDFNLTDALFSSRFESGNLKSAL